MTQEIRILRFDRDGTRRKLGNGHFDRLRVEGMTLGRASYDPGWRWSTHVGQSRGASFCETEHVGIVLSGEAAVSFPNGDTHRLRSGDVFYIAPGHDSWVVGDEPYVSLHLVGADEYGSQGSGR